MQQLQLLGDYFEQDQEWRSYEVYEDYDGDDLGIYVQYSVSGIRDVDVEGCKGILEIVGDVYVYCDYGDEVNEYELLVVEGCKYYFCVFSCIGGWVIE